MQYFSNVSVITNMYAMWKGAGSGYSHDFAPVLIPELVHWTAAPLRNGALDGKTVHCSIVGRKMTQGITLLLPTTSKSSDGGKSSSTSS
jgi:hypothetical protein